MDEKRFMSEMTDLWLVLFKLHRTMGKDKHPRAFRCVSELQLLTLTLINQSDSMNMTELAEKLLMTRQQLTKTIDSLEEKGLVMRKADPSSRRSVIIELSEKGLKFMNELYEARPNIVINMFSQLGNDDIERMFDAMSVIREVLSRLPVKAPELSDAEIFSCAPNPQL